MAGSAPVGNSRTRVEVVVLSALESRVVVGIDSVVAGVAGRSCRYVRCCLARDCRILPTMA